MAEITQLPKTQFSGLEFKNIMEDIHNLVTENPNYNSNWDDFLNSNAGRILTELFAWITDQLATRIDYYVNENFIGTATQKKSFIKLLKLINYKFSLPVAAQVPIKVSFSRPVEDYILSPSYTEGSGVVKYKTLTGLDRKGSLRSFEAIEFDAQNQKYSYKVPLILPTGTVANPELEHSVTFHEGVTKIMDFTSTSNSGQKFTIPDSPISRNSVAVYRIINEGDSLREEELLLVDNFLDPKSQKSSDIQGSNAIPYTLNVRDDDSVEIEFGAVTLLPTQDRRLPEGVKIRVFYRVGGGIDGNLTRQSINLAEKPLIDSTEVIINFKNELEGLGGVDSETIEHAAYHGPLKLRTAGKTVTPEDYDIILSSHPSILLSKSYGYNNIPKDYFDKYGTFFNPLDVVNFIILKKPGWESINTSKYEFANWGTFNLENRFNGKYWFTNGSFGNMIDLSKLIITRNLVYDYDNQGGREFKNFTILPTTEEFKKSIFLEDGVGGYVANPQMIASITKDRYDIEMHSTFNSIEDHLVFDESDPYFYGDYKESGFPRIEMREDIQAYYNSLKDVTNGLNISTGQYKFIINVDHQGDVIVDLSKSGTSPVIVPLLNQETPAVDGIIQIINDSISNAYSTVKAYQDFGILITDTTVQVPNLENRDEEPWTLRITDMNYTVSTGVDQSYDQMMIQMNTSLNPAGYEAIFVQNRVNITCYDIRIQRMDNEGSVVLEDSNNPYDILVAYEAIPLGTLPVSSGDYSNVASVVTDELGSHVKLTSPNSGSTSLIVMKPPITPSQNCLAGLFGLSNVLDGVTEYTCYGQTSLTIIHNDTDNLDFGNFIYEHGTINFSSTDPSLVYLNFIKEKKDTIRIGSYFNEEFDEVDPEWKPFDKRIYNTQYVIDKTDPEAKRELLDLEGSKFISKFTKQHTTKNSIFTIDSDYLLEEATNPEITSIDLSAFPDFTNKRLTIGINDNPPMAVNLDSVSDIDSLVGTLNDLYNEQAQELLHSKDSLFATHIEDEFGTFLNLMTDGKRGGSFKIYGETNSANILLFPNDILGEDMDIVIYPQGDYYYSIDEDNDSINITKTPQTTKIPDIPFFFHYVADRRHEYLDQEVKKVHTDEDDLRGFLEPYKICGIENKFIRPVFTTFDLKANIYITQTIPKQQIQYDVEKAVRDAYSISSTEFNKPVIKAELSKIIMDVPGVRYIEMSYFGVDLSNQEETNIENTIIAGFDEIIVLSDNVFDAQGNQTHGQSFSYNTV